VNGLLLLVLTYLRTNLCRSCFSTFCIPVGPAFTVSEFDRVDGLGLAFDVFCVTLLFLASQSLLLLNCWHCQELLYYFFDWGWIKINPKRLRIKMYSFLKAFLVLMKLLSLSQFYAPKNIHIRFTSTLWRLSFKVVESAIIFFSVYRYCANNFSSVSLKKFTFAFMYIQYCSLSRLVTEFHSKSESVTHACPTMMVLSELDVGTCCISTLSDISSLWVSVFGDAVPLTHVSHT